MKITSINAYGTIKFAEDGSVSLDGWKVDVDPPPTRRVPGDELALMLFQYLAGELRDSVLNRIMDANAVQLQAH